MILDILLAGFAVILALPVLIVVFQICMAMLPQKPVIIPSTSKTRIAVLVPAHNEESVIAATLSSIIPQLEPQDRLIVVADNCSDATAQIAGQAGAEVLVREDTTKRGKGFALDFGMQHLAIAPPDTVIIVDADCIVEHNALGKLARSSALYNRPAQGLYLMHAPAGSGIKTRIAAFAWLIKNFVRARGYAKLGLPCQLMGSGMAFPWEIIKKFNLANANLVEDLQLGIDLCKAGKPTLFVENAVISSFFPVSAKAQAGQRTRWEHGHLLTIFTEAPALFVASIKHLNLYMLAIALDLCVPPLALLVFLLALTMTLTGLLYLSGRAELSFHISLAALTLLATGILCAWAKWGRNVITFGNILMIPLYVAAKLPHYLTFLFKRQKSWVRTDRN